MDENPQAKEPLYCYQKTALKEVTKNPLQGASVLVTPISTETQKKLSGAIIELTLNHESLIRPLNDPSASFSVREKGIYSVEVSLKGYIPVTSKALVYHPNNTESVVVNMIPQSKNVFVY